LPTPIQEYYDFDGWYRNDMATGQLTSIDEMPDYDIVLDGSWIALPSYEVTVNHYTMDEFGFEYQLQESEVHTSVPGETMTTPPVKSYTGFIFPTPITVATGDDMEAIDYYYDRQEFTITYVVDGVVDHDLTEALYYGMLSEYMMIYKEGIVIDGWYFDQEYTIPAGQDFEVLDNITVYGRFQ